MNNYFKKITVLFNQQNENVRLIITLAMVIFIFFIWIFLFYSPVSHSIKNHTKKIQTARENIATLMALYRDTQLLIHAPTDALEQKMVSLAKKLKQSEPYSSEVKKNISTLADLRSALQDISKIPSTMSLNQLQNLTLEPATKSNDTSLPNQKIQIEFSGNYFETIQYLNTLEKLPWSLTFDSLEYQVEEYPNAKVKLVMYIVSTAKGAP